MATVNFPPCVSGYATDSQENAVCLLEFTVLVCECLSVRSVKTWLTHLSSEHVSVFGNKLRLSSIVLFLLSLCKNNSFHINSSSQDSYLSISINSLQSEMQNQTKKHRTWLISPCVAPHNTSFWSGSSKQSILMIVELLSEIKIDGCEQKIKLNGCLPS